MFEEIGGIPLHPLLVHAAVVFIPLQVLLSLGYALVPRLRKPTLWAVVLVNIIAPVSAAASKISGEAFRERLASRGAGTELLDAVDNHQSFGNLSLGTSIGLAVLTLVLVALRRRASTPSSGGKVLVLVLTVLVVAAAVAAAFYVFKTGDTGAHIVWSGS